MTWGLQGLLGCPEDLLGDQIRSSLVAAPRLAVMGHRATLLQKTEGGGNTQRCQALG